jgi:hypothetical protein
MLLVLFMPLVSLAPSTLLVRLAPFVSLAPARRSAPDDELLTLALKLALFVLWAQDLWRDLLIVLHR